MFFDQTVVRVRAGVRIDRGGNQIPDWSADAVSRQTILEVNVQPTTASEATTPERVAVVTGWHLQSPPGVDVDVTAMDRIEWAGMLLEVVGEVARWFDPLDGTVHHVEFDLVRATG